MHRERALSGALRSGEGRVTELLDKTSGLNLVDTETPFGFNQYVYDRYASAPHFNHLSSRIQATDLALLGERSAGGARRGYTAVVQLVWDRVTVRLVDEQPISSSLR